MAILAPDKVETAPGISPEPVSPLKPSEAIRLGAMGTYQARGKLIGANQYGPYACAIGAAVLAANIDLGIAYEWFDSKFGSWPTACPVVENDRPCFQHRSSDWADLIIHMNDYHQIPREWIANFLESIGY